MDEFLKKLPLATLIIIYFYCCGGIYLISYWNIFQFDVSNLVSLADIPKSFVYPCFAASAVLIVYLGLWPDTPSNSKPSVSTPKEWPKLLKPLKGVVLFLWIFADTNLILVICLTALMVLSAIPHIHIHYAVYPSIVLFISVCVSIKLCRTQFLVNTIKSLRLRATICSLFVFIPFFSYGIGTTLAARIYYNEDFRIVRFFKDNKKIEISPDKKDTDSLKLLGFLGDKVIVGSMDNKNLYVVDQKEFPVVQVMIKAAVK